MKESKSFPLKIDNDTCPDKDYILFPGSCQNCEYYADFKMIDGSRYILCSYPDKKKRE